MSGARRAIGRVKPMATSVARSAGRKYGVPLINRGIKKITKIRNKF
jgi:hypothetical protein